MGDNENRKVYEPRVIKNYREMIEYSVKNYADKVAYKYKKNGDLKHVEYVEKTYEQVGKDIKAFATELLNKGLEHKKIVVIGNNRYEWCISYLAVTSGNMIIVPLDKALPDNEIENLVTRSEAEVAIFDKKYVEVMKKLKNDTNVNLKMLICMDDIKDKDIENFSQLLQKGEELVKNDIFKLYNNILEKSNDKDYEKYRKIQKSKHSGFNCIGCGSCEKKCPQHLNIRELLRTKIFTLRL